MSNSSLRPVTAVCLGAFVVGSLDAAYAIAFWVPRGGTATRIFQSIAAGLLGRAAYQGGLRTAALGVLLHYFIALVIVTVYWLLARFIPLLVRRPVLCGAAYGLVVYAVMNYAVIPLSAASRPRFLLSWVACSIFMHALIIGIPAALFASRVRPS